MTHQGKRDRSAFPIQDYSNFNTSRVSQVRWRLQMPTTKQKIS
ncbi:MAG TPA: hypothetical protein V6D14_14130 [Coleofasciculaceae cyanobacterium]